MWKDGITLKWFLKNEDMCVHWINEKEPVVIMKLSLFDS
jgi:hypothetical protein